MSMLKYCLVVVGCPIFGGTELHYMLGSRYAASVGATHMHTSAKANKGVEEIFTELASRKYFCASVKIAWSFLKLQNRNHSVFHPMCPIIIYVKFMLFVLYFPA